MAQYRATALSLPTQIEKAHKSKDIPLYPDLYSNALPRCVHEGFEIVSAIVTSPVRWTHSSFFSDLCVPVQLIYTHSLHV